jgi:hypothetical protein
MSNFDTEIQQLDTAHYMHPFTDHKALGEKGARVMVRGGHLPVGFGRQEDHRRHVRPVVRERGLWPHQHFESGVPADGDAAVL